MSVGRAENHEGVSPAANWEAISLPTAAELVMASATRELGRAVWSTPRMELLRLNQSMIDIDWIEKCQHTGPGQQRRPQEREGR